MALMYRDRRLWTVSEMADATGTRVDMVNYYVHSRGIRPAIDHPALRLFEQEEAERVMDAVARRTGQGWNKKKVEAS